MPGLPSIPGLPQLPPGAATPVIATIASEAISSLLWKAAQSPPAWGVFQTTTSTNPDGTQQQNLTQVLFPDSVLEFSHRVEREISNYPVQEGAFASYNKVFKPFEIQMRFSKGGTQTDRANFLDDIQALVDSFDLYTVITPERVYPSLSAERSEVNRRGPRGAYFLTEVDVVFVQVLEVVPQYSTTALESAPPYYLARARSQAAQPVSNVGVVQPQTPTSQLQQTGAMALGAMPPEFYGG